MVLIDAQVHAYERDHPGRPWTSVLHGPSEVTGDQMVAAMDAVGVHGALLVSPWTMYRDDASYAIEVHRAHPERFALVKPFDPTHDAVGEEVAAWAAVPGAVGARLMLYRMARTPAEEAGIDAVCRAAAAAGLPLCMLAWGHLPRFAEIVRRHPETQFVLDHLGLQQPFEPPPLPEPFADLGAVVALAAHPNVAIKITGATTLSRVAFPFEDLWPHLEQIFEAYGLDRCLWGTDWTRAVGLVSYRDGVDAFTATDRLSDRDRAQLMGGTLTSLFGWSPPSPAAG